MGAVQLVLDAERGETVALKRAQQVAPEALLRLKREFRAIEKLGAHDTLHAAGASPRMLDEDPR